MAPGVSQWRVPLQCITPNHSILNQKNAETTEANPIILQVRKEITGRRVSYPHLTANSHFSQLISVISDEATIATQCPNKTTILFILFLCFFPSLLWEQKEKMIKTMPFHV